jgi:hypothetical protein
MDTAKTFLGGDGSWRLLTMFKPLNIKTKTKLNSVALVHFY